MSDYINLLNAGIELPCEDVEIKGYGKIRVRDLTAGDAERLQSKIAGKDIAGEAAAWYLRYYVVDEQGVNIYSDDDIEALSEIPNKVANDVVRACLNIKQPSLEDIKKK